MATGYSKKSLIKKLGIKEGFKIIILNPPEGYYQTLGSLPKGVFVSRTLKGPFDFIHFFARKRDELESKFTILKELSQNGVLWVSWTKGSSRVKTDLNENIVREIGLKNGLVDVKVISVDNVWAGLKFVYRVKERK
jgi:hypothetical protein